MKTIKELINEQGYSFWDGQVLDSPIIAFDTETDIVDLKREIPTLVLMTVSTYENNYVVPHTRVTEFVSKHQEVEAWVGHNVAFDYWVVLKHLKKDQDSGRYRANCTGIWKELYAGSQFKDTMHLDFLVRLATAKSRQHFRGRNLGEVAKDWASVEVDKEDPYRMRFSELLEVPVEQWETEVERGFFEYACGDTAVVLPIYFNLEATGNAVLANEKVYEKRFGLLTETLQVKADIVLKHVSRLGINVDCEKVEELESTLKKEIDNRVEWLEEYRRDLFHRYKEKKRAGQLQYNKANGLPKMNKKVLCDILEGIASENGITDIPRTDKTKAVKSDLEYWTTKLGGEPFIQVWSEMADMCKKRQFTLKLMEDRIHPSYRILVSTGRTSCHDPNIQQIPRDPVFRTLFRADPGRILGIVDYSYIELVTLAAVLEDRYGESRLGDIIRQGIDPHVYTAAMVNGMEIDSFLQLKEDAPLEFKRKRQAAKALNFGFPGGLGIKKFCAYAYSNYGVSFTEEQARKFKWKLTNEVYPFLGRYLSDDSAVILSRNLECEPEFCRKLVEGTNSFSGAWIALEKIIRGEPYKADGTPYDECYVDKVWNILNRLNKNSDIEQDLAERKAGVGLQRKLMNRTTSTLTGRVRGGTSYTEDRNTPFQGLAADGAKLAIVRLFEEGFKICIFIHDEIVTQLPIETAEEDLKKQEKIMQDAMSSILKCDIPVRTEGVLAEAWAK